MTERLDALDAVLTALGTDADTHSSTSARIAKAKEGHAIVAAIRESVGAPSVVAKLNEPLTTMPTAKVAIAPKGGLEVGYEPPDESPAAIKTAEMLAAMDADEAGTRKPSRKKKESE